jgi:hypothetical protein
MVICIVVRVFIWLIVLLYHYRKPWETGEEEFMYETIQKMMMLSYFISKSDYTDKEYYDIVNGQLGLPDYDSVFNNLGIVNDGFLIYLQIILV